ncbi:FxSxx-COOH system tetratricopeptide repeat protein [Nonomuraea guangzhouensis]|uniref:FxSxx-COOH system tetratricopeptide repeat protein n=1 Tax=Nonomuraea guangzhouensis TaxID=1291555 RepID=A0ABW4GQ03_9ACTN|nr:FxSxx-COOH system tetratricopeptide repeat protein [Nonomuraea guangzhouensis]
MTEQPSPQGTSKMPPIWGKKIPGRNKHFTGREILLEQLRESLATAATATAVVPLPQTLQGLGGVGKTQLAIEYAWRYRGHYDLVWWVPADQTMLVPSVLAALTEDLKLAPASTAGIEEAAASVREALQRGEPVDRWLLIFDNADEPEEIKEFIPQGGPGHVLITSRNTRWSGVADTVSVDVFSTSESVAFLRKRLQRDVAQTEAEHLASELGDLPLALEQAAALQVQTGMSTDEYVELLAKQTRALLGMSKSTEYPQTMTAAWQLSVQEVESRLPEAAEVLRCLAFFAPDPIPRIIFRRGIRSGAQRMGPILANPLVLNQAFAELNRFALIKIEHEVGTVQVHRLVQALLRDSLSKQEQDEFRHEVHLLLAGGAPADPEDTDSWDEYANLLPHVRPSRLVESNDERVQRFAIDIVRYLYRTANYPSAKAFAEEFLTSWAETTGNPSHPNVLRLRRHLGNVLWQMGSYTESRTLNEKTLDLMRKEFGSEHEETLRLSLTYGANLRSQGRFRDALEQDEATMAAHEKLFPSSHPSTLRAINNLALDYALLSRYDKAVELQQLAFVEQTTAREGVSTWDVQLSWNGLARVVRLNGKHSQACDVGEEAYAHGIRRLKIEHPLTLMAARDLSIARRRVGELDEALELIQETHSRLNKLFGPNDPETMAATVALSNTLRQKGHHEEAMALAQDILPRYEHILGEQHPFTYGCVINLALLYRERGDALRAKELDEKAHAGMQKRLGADHAYTFTAGVNLASDLAALDDPARARELDQQILTRMRAFYGENHLLTLAVAMNLSIDLGAVGDTAASKALHESTLARYEDQLPVSHPERVHAAHGNRFSWDFDAFSL